MIQYVAEEFIIVIVAVPKQCLNIKMQKICFISSVTFTFGECGLIRKIM